MMYGVISTGSVFGFLWMDFELCVLVVSSLFSSFWGQLFSILYLVVLLFVSSHCQGRGLPVFFSFV